MRANPHQALTPPLAKLAHTLGLLGSKFDGEALAAARAAERQRLAMGTTWPELLRPLAAPQPTPADHRAVAAEILRHHRPALFARELQFLADVQRQYTPLSTKQQGWLDKICKRCGLRAAA